MDGDVLTEAPDLHVSSTWSEKSSSGETMTRRASCPCWWGALREREMAAELVKNGQEDLETVAVEERD